MGRHIKLKVRRSWDYSNQEKKQMFKYSFYLEIATLQEITKNSSVCLYQIALIQDSSQMRKKRSKESRRKGCGTPLRWFNSLRARCTMTLRRTTKKCLRTLKSSRKITYYCMRISRRHPNSSKLSQRSFQKGLKMQNQLKRYVISCLIVGVQNSWKTSLRHWYMKE